MIITLTVDRTVYPSPSKVTTTNVVRFVGTTSVNALVVATAINRRQRWFHQSIQLNHGTEEYRLYQKRILKTSSGNTRQYFENSAIEWKGDIRNSRFLARGLPITNKTSFTLAVVWAMRIGTLCIMVTIMQAKTTFIDIWALSVRPRSFILVEGSVMKSIDFSATRVWNVTLVH